MYRFHYIMQHHILAAGDLKSIPLILFNRDFWRGRGGYTRQFEYVLEFHNRFTSFVKNAVRYFFNYRPRLVVRVNFISSFLNLCCVSLFILTFRLLIFDYKNRPNSIEGHKPGQMAATPLARCRFNFLVALFT